MTAHASLTPFGPLSVFTADVLSGHVALITGGGTGIGQAIARAYHRAGASVILVGRRASVLADAAASMVAATQPASASAAPQATHTAEPQCAGGVAQSDPALPCVAWFAADVRDAQAMEAAVAFAVATCGHLDTLVNAAAGNFLVAAEDLTANGFRAVVEIDLLGTFHACRAALPALRQASRGAIINISTTLAQGATPMQAHAAAAKAGVDALTRNLAVEWAPYGIRVVGIAPGPIANTEGVQRLVRAAEANTARVAAIPAGRLGALDEVAALAVFLRSSAAAYITGTTVVQDGGLSVVSNNAQLLGV